MGIKISQLPLLALGNVRPADVLPIVDVQTLGTKKITIADIKSYSVGDLSTLARTGQYDDIVGKPQYFPIQIATANQLGGVKIGPHLTIEADGTVDMGPAFDTINVGNDQLSAMGGMSSLNFLAGNNITLDVNPVTNTITFNSSGGGGGGTGNVGNGTTGTLAVYFARNIVTGTNITYSGDSITVPGPINATGGLIADKITATTFVTTIGDIILAPAGNISITGKRITNVSTPVGANDAATKGYVDNQSSRAFGKVAVSGQGTVSATSGTDTLNFVAGNNVTLTTNPGTKAVTIAVNNTLTFQLLPASTSSIGGVIIGTGLQIDGNGILSSQASALTTATTSTLGGIIIGDGLAIDGNGRLSSAAAFTLNTATVSVLGGIKVGFGLSIDNTGVLSVPTQVLSSATRFILGGVKIGNSISAAVDGTIDVNAAQIPAATTVTNGVVRPGYGLSVDQTGALSLGVDGNFTITGNLAVNGVISATNIFTTGTSVTIISSANDLQLRAAGQVITNTTLFVNTSTPATSTSTGALQVWGGIGIGKNIITGEASIINGVLIGQGGGNGIGNYNIAVGSGAVQSNQGASYLTGVGFNALLAATAGENSAFGYNAGANVTGGTKNTLIGISSGVGMTAGTFNSALGHQAFVGTGASSYNTILGSYINYQSSVVQSNNTLIGYQIQSNTVRPGSYNVAVGGNNLQATTGSNNIVIGYGAGSALTTANNQVIIGSYDGNAIATLSNYISLADGAGNLRAQWDNKGQATFFNTATFYATQNATNATGTGAIIVAGGMGVAKDLYVGQNLYVGGSPVITALTLGTPISSIVAGTDTAVVTQGTAVTIYNTSTLQTIMNRGATTTVPLRVASNSNSTGTSTGALTVVGGVGFSNDLYVGAGIFAGADSTASSTATTIGLFDRGRRVMTQAILIGDQGIDITTASNTATVMSFNIKNTGVRSIEAGTDISITANGTNFVGPGTGTIVISASSNFDTVTRRGADAGVPVRILQTSTISTGTSSGGLVVLGGMGLTGPLNINGSITLNGAALSTASVFNGGTITAAMFINNATLSTSTNIGTSGNGALSVAGGVSVLKDLNIGGNIYINGLQLSTSTIFNGGAITNSLTVNNATAATTTQTGALVVGGTNGAGGLGVGGRVVAKEFYIQPTAGGTTYPVGYGPMLSATLSVAQASVASGTPTKVTFQTEEYDSGGFYDNVSNFRFLPSVGGYYDVRASVLPIGSATGLVGVSIYKNGAAYKSGNKIANNTVAPIPNAGCTVSLNGLTDYVEVFFTQTTGGAMTLPVSSTATYFQVSFLRGL